MATETHPPLETSQEISIAQQSLTPPVDPNYMPFDTEKTQPLVEIKGTGLVPESDAIGVDPSMIQEYPSQFIKKAPEPSPESTPTAIPQSPEVDKHAQEQERKRQETARKAAEIATRTATTLA